MLSQRHIHFEYGIYTEGTKRAVRGIMSRHVLHFIIFPRLICMTLARQTRHTKFKTNQTYFLLSLDKRMLQKWNSWWKEKCLANCGMHAIPYVWKNTIRKPPGKAHKKKGLWWWSFYFLGNYLQARFKLTEMYTLEWDEKIPFKLLNPNCCFMYHQVLTFENSKSCPHRAFTCFEWFSEKTSTFTSHSINWLTFINELESVYCAVRTTTLNKGDYVLLAISHGLLRWTMPALYHHWTP